MSPGQASAVAKPARSSVHAGDRCALRSSPTQRYPVPATDSMRDESPKAVRRRLTCVMMRGRSCTSCTRTVPNSAKETTLARFRTSSSRRTTAFGLRRREVPSTTNRRAAKSRFPPGNSWRSPIVIALSVLGAGFDMAKERGPLEDSRSGPGGVTAGGRNRTYQTRDNNMTQHLRIPPHVLLLFVIACGGNPGEANASSGGAGVEGATYTVASVNAAPLPALLPTLKGCALTGLAGSLTFRSAGRFGVTYRYLSNCRGVAQTIERQISGRYSVNGVSLVLAPDSGFSKFAVVPPISGTFAGSTITIVGSPRAGTTVTVVVRR